MAAFYYANPLFLMGMSLSVYAFLIDAYFSVTQLGSTTRRWCNSSRWWEFVSFSGLWRRLAI